MGVSRGSLREAVRVLAYLGIIDVRVGDGGYVTDLNGERLLSGLNLMGQVADKRTALEIFEIRRVLESAAAALAASRISDDQLDELEQHLDLLNATSEREHFVERDIRFHDLIAATSGNVTLQMLCRSFSSQTQRARLLLTENIEGNLSRSTTDHQDIFRHIKEREPILAAATSHVANVEFWSREEYSNDTPGD